MLDIRKISVLLLSFIIGIAASAAENDEEFEVRTVLDTTRAVTMMNGKIAKVNAPVVEQLKILTEQAARSEELRNATADSLRYIQRLSLIHI